MRETPPQRRKPLKLPVGQTIPTENNMVTFKAYTKDETRCVLSLQRAMRSYWETNLRFGTDFWSQEIDETADILLMFYRNRNEL